MRLREVALLLSKADYALEKATTVVRLESQ